MIKNDSDIDLMRLFDEQCEPAQGELFVKQVSNRIARRRYVHRGLLFLFAFAGAAFFNLLSPWMSGLTGYIAIGSSIFANSIIMLSLSPAGWAIAGGIGLTFFLKTRL